MMFIDNLFRMITRLEIAASKRMIKGLVKPADRHGKSTMTGGNLAEAQ